jgi:translation initiation factor eIF-2B subunit gamma
MVSSEGVALGDKVSIKHSCIGKYCIIGDKTKLLNCIIMDHVQIGEGCVHSFHAMP